MACNCGKNQPKPNGMTSKGGAAPNPQSQQAKQRAGATSNGKSLTAGGFVLTKPNGQREHHSRELDAKAARVRAGGGTIQLI